MSHSYYNIGGAYKNLKDTAGAIPWLNKALTLANVINEKEIIFKANESLAEVKASDNNYKQAYESLKVAVNANDSILSVGKTKIIEELITKYQTAEKEARIKTLHQQAQIQQFEIERRNVFLAVAGGVILVGSLIAYLIMNRRKLQERARIQEEINKQQDLAARAVLDAEERERRRIAGDLHDGVGQLLSAALMNLNGLFGKLKFDTEQEIQASSTLALVNESYDEMRTISHQMMPNALLKAGLASAVKEFLSKIDQEKIKVSLETVGLNERLNEQTETVLYRVIQETVNNVIKHARASRLNIQLMKDADGVSVSIEDNGQGFDKKELIYSKGIGMSNILTRVEFLKGTVDVDTAPGKGTLIAIHIPA
ncbi:MAG: sensor histidine kinase [Chitinophagaceae bacterium]|nr:MAG: sensor histidine kinase [Chitinophagaceae bacterium]